MKLKDKVAIVTGGSQGIGRAIALRFAREGAVVVVANRNRARAMEVRAEIEELGGRAEVISADISQKDQIDRLAEEAEAIGDGVDILVNNAGVLLRSSFMDATEENWDTTMNTNLKGTFLLSRAVARNMIRRGRKGKIVNITSIDGQVVYYHGHHAAYGVSKAGIIMLTKGMGVELAPQGINVNAIAPGVVRTEISTSMKDESHYQSVVRDIPLGRLADAGEIAGAAVFLASDEAGYMVGETLVVDGGWVAH